MLNIPGEGWIALSIWFTVIVVPWLYSVILIKKINKSGVERWGAKKSSNSNAGDRIPADSEVKV